MYTLERLVRGRVEDDVAAVRPELVVWRVIPTLAVDQAALVVPFNRMPGLLFTGAELAHVRLVYQAEGPVEIYAERPPCAVHDVQDVGHRVDGLHHVLRLHGLNQLPHLLADKRQTEVHCLRIGLEDVHPWRVGDLLAEASHELLGHLSEIGRRPGGGINQRGCTKRLSRGTLSTRFPSGENCVELHGGIVDALEDLSSGRVEDDEAFPIWRAPVLWRVVWVLAARCVVLLVPLHCLPSLLLRCA
mmetsp:Transcript_78706/g.205259  ORF Transcript_78706/g.205259 Transcript_78706/m.205259 type:complete len:245 (-) Transcript_78706:364-1098(-)